MSNDRIDPFADLSDFTTKQKSELLSIEKNQIEALSKENDFPSRQAIPSDIANTTGIKPRRRYTTGRNQQINIKAKAETVSRLYRLADSNNIPLGELLERALDALERQGT